MENLLQQVPNGIWKWKFHSELAVMVFLFSTHENLFPNFYIINVPSIIGIQFIDGVGESIVKLYNPI